MRIIHYTPGFVFAPVLRCAPFALAAICSCGSGGGESATSMDAGNGGTSEAAADGYGTADSQGTGDSGTGGTPPVVEGGLPEASPPVDAGGCDACAPGALFIAPTGNDANPGTLAQPLLTLTKARDLVQARTSTMTSDITVYLRGGTYPVTSTVTFANADSGKNGFYVRYSAYPGERPLVTGGQPITGWKVFDATKGIYSVSGVTTPFRQLYVNGVKAVRARTPNIGPNGAANFYRTTGYDTTADNIQVSTSQVSTWKNLTKVEMHLMVDWADNTMRLAGITTSGNTAYVTFQNPESSVFFVRPNPGIYTRSDHVYYFENALEFLDQPGEWYLDETASTLYYMPRTSEDMPTATVVAPMVETVLAVDGTSPDDQAGYLWFQGLTFAHSTYMRPSQYGFLDAQAGQYNLTADANNNQTVGRPAAGVSVTNANHIHFEMDMFTQMAATGLDFVSGTNNDTILGNVFTDIGGAGFSIGKFTASDTTEYHVAYNPADPNEICTSDTIRDNYITNVTTEIQGAPGIAAGYPRSVDIEHNEVSNVNYTGISVGYGWTATANAMNNNRIDYNNVHDIGLILGDCGAIYTLSNQMPMSEMLYNYLHDYTTSQWADYGPDNGIYMDEQTDGYTVEHNVLTNLGGGIPAVHQNKNGPNDTVSDNGTNPSMAQSTMSTAGLEPTYVGIKNLTIPVPSF